MSPCSVLVLSLVLISFNKIDSATIKTGESSTLEHNPVDSINIDAKVVSKRSDETSVTEANASVEHPNTLVAVGTVDGDASKESDFNSQTEADSRIVRNVPITSTSDDDDSVVISGPEYLPPISTTSGPEYLPPFSTPGPQYLPPPVKPGDDDEINPKTIIGTFG